jgi:BlaI family penicillinase repressor
MKEYKLTESEEKFAELIWQNEPMGSGDLVKLCEKEMNWKKSTTYTVLKKLCEKGIFQNENAVVSSLITRDEYYAKQSIRFVEDTFGLDCIHHLLYHFYVKGCNLLVDIRNNRLILYRISVEVF